jgi:4-alpha-glucanotransferase
MAVLPTLYELAESCGVQTSYRDTNDVLQRASPAALVAVLRALGEDIDDVADAADALRARQARCAARVVEPCVVAWDDVGVSIDVAARDGVYAACLELETGEIRTWRGALSDLRVGVDARRQLDLPAGLGYGYHKLIVEIARCTHQVAVIAAPSRCYSAAEQSPCWGAFAPLYALRSARSDRYGGADFRDLATAIEWISSLGGSLVGTLPLLATFLDAEPLSPSPYTPVSARMWNELYLDLGAIPEVDGIPEGLREQAAMAAAADEVDYAALARLRRAALERGCARLYSGSSPRRAELEAFAAANPLVVEYAQFRGRDEAERRYHLYAQWLCRQQLTELARLGLYLDFPVGIHPRGFDAWRERDVFAAKMAIGAPPDALFAGGQNWAVPALHPERSRGTGHRYFAECLRAHTELAQVLRIDHVMGLYRRFWVPDGMAATEGVYVRQPAQELTAVIALESHRSRCAIVGEDLGTVEPAVRVDMSLRNMRGMFVAQFDLDGEVPVGSVASLNTHDMPPFAAFWQDGEPAAALREQLTRLAASDAWLVIVALEDLWLEPRSQNRPGTSDEYPNWRGKMRYSLDELPERNDVVELLAWIDRVRREPRLASPPKLTLKQP